MILLAAVLVIGQALVIWVGTSIVHAIREHTAAIRNAILAFQGSELLQHQYNRALLEALRGAPSKGKVA